MFRVSHFLFSEQVVLRELVGKIGVLKLNRPKALNALNVELVQQLAKNLQEMDKDPKIGAIVVTGEGKAFAAGADIKMMQDLKFSEVFSKNLFAELDCMKQMTTPVIAAVNGFAFGGGCELAMCCDIIIASTAAKFGQPEIKLGTIPGMGGTQRLTQALGKSKAMEWCLTGDAYSAEYAEKAGLVSMVVEPEKLMEVAMKMANKIASNSKIVNGLCKQAVNASRDMGLQDGLTFEKRIFQSTFATEDRKEGMSAFVEKRAPKFTDC